MNHNQDELYSDFLFARPSFIEGLGRIVDLSGSLNIYNTSRSPSEADARAIYGDWNAVAHDLRVALEQLQTDSDERP